MLSSYCLVIVNAANTPASFSLMSDLTNIPMMDGILEAMKFIEFGTFVVIPLSFVVWKIWERLDTKKRDDLKGTYNFIGNKKVGINRNRQESLSI